MADQVGRQVGRIDLEEVRRDDAEIYAGLLLRTLGIEPDLDPADNSRAAQMLRRLALEERTATITRSRRSV